jgi:hypothetical protein
MRLRPISRAERAARIRRDAAAFTGDSHLRGIVLRMITLNSLAAFTQEISRRPGGAEPVRAASSSPPASGVGASGPATSAGPQRVLDAVPAQPVRPVPRGSLLDLRV